MADAHLSLVQQRANELQAAADAELAADPDVQLAQVALEAARRALNLDRHNPARQQAVRDAEHEYLAVTNTYHRNQNLAKIEAEKEAKRLKVDAENAVLEERRKAAAEMTPEKAALLKKYATML